MKVKDLIKILEKYNQNAEVFISDLNTLTDEKNSFKYIDSNILHNKYKETCDYVGLIGEEFSEDISGIFDEIDCKVVDEK